MHAGIPSGLTGDGGGGVWSSLGRLKRSGGLYGTGGECFYRSRRVTTLEPQDTLAAVSLRGTESILMRESVNEADLLDA